MRLWRRHTGFRRASLILALAGLIYALPAGIPCSDCFLGGEHAAMAEAVSGPHAMDHARSPGDQPMKDGQPDDTGCCQSCPLGCAVAIVSAPAPTLDTPGAPGDPQRPDIHTTAVHRLATPPPRSHA